MRRLGQTMFVPRSAFFACFVEFCPINAGGAKTFRHKAGMALRSGPCPASPLSNPPDIATVKICPRRHINRAGVTASMESMFHGRRSTCQL